MPFIHIRQSLHFTIFYIVLLFGPFIITLTARTISKLWVRMG